MKSSTHLCVLLVSCLPRSRATFWRFSPRPDQRTGRPSTRVDIVPISKVKLAAWLAEHAPYVRRLSLLNSERRGPVIDRAERKRHDFEVMHAF